MIIISLNSRGVGGAPKQQALKRLCVVYKTDVLLLQETICARSNVVEFFSSFLKDWNFYSVVSRWNYNLVAILRDS
jgi:exonuclease III